jgi:UDP-N-acetylglucosamine 3-dehydrogenase
VTRVAVIGTGSMGRNHVRVLMDLPQADLVGIADKDSEGVRALAKRYSISGFEDHRRLLSETKPEAVVIAVPTVHHHRVALDAIEAGAHVLVEKPIASTVEEAKELIDAAKRRNVSLMVGHIERFNPAVIELKKRLDEGAIGRVFMIHARRQSPYPRRIQDVGVASDLATHELDMMRYLTNENVEYVSAQVASVLSEGREDIVFGILRFASGVMGVLDVNWVTPTTVREVTITGERGMFVVNYLAQELTFFENPAAAPVLLAGSTWDYTVKAGNMIRYQIQKKEPLRSELESFVDCVSRRSPVVVDGKDGLAALELALGIMRNELRTLKRT